ncbi:MAG: DUF5654 family protein [bacterium]|nr:DUF5654 family protein [bacterium]
MHKELKNKIVVYITTSLGLVAGLAWNDAITSFINHVFTLEKNTVLAKFVYAVIITLVVVFLATYISKMISGDDKK